MQHLTALTVKYLATATLLGITLGLMGRANLMQVLGGALALTIVAYIVGDLFILPATSNVVATAADFFTAWAVLRIVLPGVAVGGPLLASLIGLAIVEYLFHIYLKDGIVEPAR